MKSTSFKTKLNDFFRNPGHSADLDVDSYHLVTVAHYILTSAVFIHSAITIMFLVTGLFLAASINMGCIVLVLAAKRANAAGSHYAAIFMGFIDTFICALIAVILGGPGTNYEIYMLIIMSFLPLMPKPCALIRLLMGIGIAAVYVTILWLTRFAPPPVYILGAGFLRFMSISNTLIAFSILQLVVYFMATSVRSSYRKVRQMADTDPLTGLLNRRGMQDAMEQSKRHCEETGRPWSLVMGDIDHFKRLNDIHGHEMGDKVLKSVAQAIASALRAEDLCARWGGEEFLIFIPGVQGPGLEAIVFRIVSAVRSISLPPCPEACTITISLGATTASAGETEPEVALRADEALYQAKEEGRDRAIFRYLQG